MAFLLALLAAMAYGTGDFFGGLAARKTALLRALFWVQIIGLAMALAIYAVHHPDHFSGSDITKGSAAGAAAVLGAGLFYRGFQLGAIGVVAPLAALGTALVPLSYALIDGERPGVLPLIGAVLAMFAVVLIARSSNDQSRRLAAGAQYGIGAGLAWGIALTLLSAASSDSGFVPLVSARIVAVILVGAALLIWRIPPATPRTPWALVGISAAGDVGATALQLLAFSRGLTSVVAPVSSLYPAFTVLLARLVLRERIGRTQAFGLAVAACGLVLLGLR